MMLAQLVVLIAFLASAASSGSKIEALFTSQTQRKRNVLLVIADDLRAQIDVLGFPFPAMHTPNLRRLSSSKGAFTFTRAYVQQALCAPSRNSFLTGRRPNSTLSWNFVDHFREPSAPTSDSVSLPQAFKKAGYLTLGTGKVFHPQLPPNWDLPLSWSSELSDGSWSGWMYPKEPRCPQGTVWCAIEKYNVSDFDDTQVTLRAKELLTNATTDEQGRPFFLAVGYRKPHVQWRFPSHCLAPYEEDSSVGLPKHKFFPNSTPSVAFHQPINDFLDPFSDVSSCGGESMSPSFAFRDSCQLAWRKAYAASVTFLDEQVGELLDHLEDLGQTDNTVVAFVSDHGWQLGEFAEWEKFTNFEIAARVPLIFRVPWAENGKVTRRHSSTLVELIDLFPTLLNLTGIPSVDGLEGVSLAPHIMAALGGLQEEPKGKSFALTEFPRCIRHPDALWKDNDCDGVSREKFTYVSV